MLGGECADGVGIVVDPEGLAMGLPIVEVEEYGRDRAKGRGREILARFVHVDDAAEWLPGFDLFADLGAASWGFKCHDIPIAGTGKAVNAAQFFFCGSPIALLRVEKEHCRSRSGKFHRGVL